MIKFKQILSSFLSLFTSFSTLICCALPALLVTLGLGAVVAAAISTFPFLITLSRHKGWVFLLAGVTLGLNLFLVYRKRGCPADEASTCGVVSKWNKIILWLSVGIYLVGFFVAYMLFPILLSLRVIQ